MIGQVWIKNPSAIKQFELEKWVDLGLVKYLGFTEDVRPFIKSADVVILPSYREGVAKILIEAASMSKPIITTDVPGCRETVDDGITGLLCKDRDAEDLARKMIQVVELSDHERAEMGRLGRIKMEQEFDEKIVLKKYLESISSLIKN